MREGTGLRWTGGSSLFTVMPAAWALLGACSDSAIHARVAQTVADPKAVVPTPSSAAAGQPGSAGASANGPRPGMSSVSADAGAPMLMVGTTDRGMLPGAGASGVTTSAAAAGGVAAAGSSGAAGIRGSTAGAGPMPIDGDVTAVCKGGTPGMDSDMAKVQGLNISREYAAVKYLSVSSNPILSLKTTLQVPKTPVSKQTLFIWPGLQCRGASDPGRVGNGILEPVLTWGTSCAPKAPKDGYAAWWMAAMYVNVSSSAAGPTGCAGGDYMDTQVGDQLFIDMSLQDSKWSQTIVNMRTMKSVDLTSDLKGQVQNWATWAVEVPSGESIKPVEDTIFTQNVLTFTNPVTSCQPNQAGGSDYYSAPVLSPDGLHCCYDKIILRADRSAGR